ncbi:cache domain-containing protein [Nocardioides sp.]|uniref:cache domain-containing protein n=1 Tax=Nocardioides sp. TaxID=35761 RepID=UPI002ED67180
MPNAVGRPLDTLVAEVIERVFATVEDLHRETLACHQDAVASGRTLTDDDIRGLAPGIAARLQEPDQVAVGLGLILEPGLLQTHPLRIEWWQWSTTLGEPVQMEFDLRPDSIGFYDYATTDWFAVPRRTRERHVVGPYVDVHGTDRYLLTLTMPIESGGDFLGVAGADVPLTVFETTILRHTGEDDAAVVNREGRVVLSTSSRWITGSLVPRSERLRARPLPGLPWALID